MSVHNNLYNYSDLFNSHSENSTSTWIPIACTTIAMLGMLGTTAYFTVKRLRTREESPQDEETTAAPAENEIDSLKNEEENELNLRSLFSELDETEDLEKKETSSSTDRETRMRERNRARKQRRRTASRSTSSGSSQSSIEKLSNAKEKEEDLSDSNYLAVSSSESSSSGSTTPRKKTPVSSSAYIFTSSVSPSIEPPRAPQTANPLYITENFLSFNVPKEHYNRLKRNIGDLLRRFTPTEVPHITLADKSELSRELNRKDQNLICQLFIRLYPDFNIDIQPRQLKIILHRENDYAPLEELLILDVDAWQLDSFRHSLLIDEYIRPDSMQHLNSGFHITLGRRYIDFIRDRRDRNEMETRWENGNRVIEMIEWPESPDIDN